MFKKLTKSILKQTGSTRRFVPVESFPDNKHFRPLCLLTKKRKLKHIFHPDPYYEDTGLTLDEVLLAGEDGKRIEPIYQDSSQFTLTKTSAYQGGGEISFTVSRASAGAHGAVSLSNEFSIMVEKKSVPEKSLEALSKQRKIDMDHSFFQNRQRTDIELYVVTETLKAAEEVVYKEYTKAGWGFKAECYVTISAQGTRENIQSIVIEKGSTLAFRIIPLHIRDGAWYLHNLPRESWAQKVSLNLDYFLTQDKVIEILEEVGSQKELTTLQKEVKDSCRIFPELSSDLLHILLNTIKAVMRDKNLLQELSQKMEKVPEQKDGYELKTESPALQALFSSLQHSPRDHFLQLAEGITYVLDALHELMEDQLLLLLESLERKIVSQQLKLVENILTHDLMDEMNLFYVDAELLSFPHEEEQKLTIALVELSGVQLQEDGLGLSRNHPFKAVAALFVALYALNLLSGSK